MNFWLEVPECPKGVKKNGQGKFFHLLYSNLTSLRNRFSSLHLLATGPEIGSQNFGAWHLESQEVPTLSYPLAF